MQYENVPLGEKNMDDILIADKTSNKLQHHPEGRLRVRLRKQERQEMPKLW